MRRAMTNMWIVAVVLAVPWATVSAQTPMGTAFTYQGRLADGGVPANGDYDSRFELYDAETDGSQVGDTVFEDDVTVANGLFTVQVDFGTDIFAGDALWLEVGVRPGDSTGAYTTLDPRQELTPVPYAIQAETATAVPGGISGSGTANYIAKFVDSNTIGDSVIYESAGAVGIGTPSPAHDLDVQGEIYASDGLHTGDSAYGDGVRFGNKYSSAADINPIVTCRSGYLWWDYSEKALKLTETNAYNGYCHYAGYRLEHGIGLSLFGSFVPPGETKTLATLSGNGGFATVQITSEGPNAGYIFLHCMYSNGKFVAHYRYRYQ